MSLFHVGIEPGPLPLEGRGNAPDVIEFSVAVGLHLSVAVQEGLHLGLHVCHFSVICAVMFCQQLEDLCGCGEEGKEGGKRKQVRRGAGEYTLIVDKIVGWSTHVWDKRQRCRTIPEFVGSKLPL